MAANEWTGEWQWTETEWFVQDCHTLHPSPGEVDWIRGVIGDWIVANPIGRSLPADDPSDPWYDPNLRQFRTDAALTGQGVEVASRIVIFETGPPPMLGEPTRLLTGLYLRPEVFPPQA